MKSHYNVSKALFSFGIILGVTSFTYLKLVDQAKAPIIFQSLESKNGEGGPVINEVRWYEFPDKDVWMMNQNHDGLTTNSFDRLAIIVDKTVNPKTAQFMQLEPGPLEWSEDLYKKQIPFKVSCFTCHTNGPRALRAEWSGLIKKGSIDRVKINFLNIKMKLYKRTVAHPSHTTMDGHSSVPFKKMGHLDNEKLEVKACTKCHNNQLRGALTRQNIGTIKFAVENELMPPPLFGSLSAKDLKKIQQFVDGF